MKTSIIHFFERDLTALKAEISLYKDENNLWITTEHIANSGGNLALHLIGNLNHFIGATLGNTGYIRKRDKEFSDKNIPREKLLSEIDKVLSIVKNTINNLSEEDLAKEFPLKKHNETVLTGAMLLHLIAHLSYHLGQINYHRRFVE